FASASLKGQNYEATTVALSAREMLTSTVDGSVSLGYGQANYHAAAQGVQANREDEYYYGRLSLNWLINRKCSLGWFYEYNKNLSSGDQGHPFQRNRIGVAFNVSF
ncbi:MAG: outer membrane beta-barrel protein, partial [Chthoniobacteraceae bacterium]|nr:outer membrane beta-barrel protein [Chthoniobacteraceae bacterium]